MPDPISSTPLASAHYDHDAGQCTAEPLESAASPSTPAISSTATPLAAMSSPPDPEPAQDAVNQLVKNHSRGSGEDDRACLRQSIKTAASCGGAIGAALATPVTLVSAAGAVLAGAACGASLADVEAACRQQ